MDLALSRRTRGQLTGAAWVRKALDSFVRYGLAAPIEGVDGEYLFSIARFGMTCSRNIRLRETKGEGTARPCPRSICFRK